MNTERAQKLQERIMREAVALLAIHGKGMETGHYETGVRLIGKAWSLPNQDTRRRLELIAQERTAVRDAETPADLARVQHVIPETELPVNASGMETLDNVWDLFETSTKLADPDERTALFALATELAESQNLLDWIEKTEAERQLPVLVSA